MPEYEQAMKNLLKLVVRSFYEPHHVVITDILLENVLLSDTEFCARMKMLSREFNRLIIRLKDDKLIKSDIKVETKEDNKQVLKNVYFFNYAEARDVIKYKIYKMRKALEVKKVSEDEALYCPACERHFSTLDAQALVEDYSFKCIFCKNELQECTHKSNDRELDMKELLSALNEIIVLLKVAEKYEIPSMDYFQILEIKKDKLEEKKSEAKDESKKGGLNVDKDEEPEEPSEETVRPVPEVAVEAESINELVTVSGMEKPFSEVTEEDKEIMTEEEYTRYFEIYAAHHQQ